MKRSEIYGYSGTALFALLVVLILILVVMPGIKSVPEDDGVMISFGDVFDGGGFSPTPSQNVTSTRVPTPTSDEELITQRDPSVSLNESKQRTEQSQSVQNETQERLRREQEALQKADDLIGGSFGQGSSSGSGQNSTDATSGNPVGSGVSGGNSWSLSGRNLVGTMPTPRYDQNEEGFIIVEIRVDAKGSVVGAKVTRYSIANRTLHQASINAALQTRFTSGDGVAVGTITYNFKLR